MNDLSTLPPVKPDQGLCQWVQCVPTGIDPTQAVRTHTFGIPNLMPGTVIFVHGVNSEGEWYRDAAEQFALGLNARLGRDDLERLREDPRDKKRLAHTYEETGKRIRSPVIPFYWGYCPAEVLRVEGDDEPRSFVDPHGNYLRRDGSWGGGPFQNGTTELSAFWNAQGFDPQLLRGLIDVNAINPAVGRKLFKCPSRLYYVHAARRLAHLVKTIRDDLPNEPINIVAHSQGTMIALCALFFLDRDQVRGPDTLVLNSSPYRFDTHFTDYLAAASGSQPVASVEARVQTFRGAAQIMQKARSRFTYVPAPRAECTHQPVHRHKYDDKLFAHQPPDNPQWQAEIGAGDVTNRHGQRVKWWQDPQRARDNRGSLFVNFNPGDRLIGVSAIEGVGWRGIPSQYIGEGRNELGDNVMQRMLVRGAGGDSQRNPPVGERTGYKMDYFYVQIERAPVRSSGDGVTWRTDSGAPLATEVNEGWRYLDSTSGQWRIASEKVGMLPLLGDMAPRGDGGRSESVYINAPVVARPAELGMDFDLQMIRFDGLADPARRIEADAEQQEDYADFLAHEPRGQKDLATGQAVSCSGMPQKILCLDDKGFKTWRYETYEEVEIRLRDWVGKEAVPPTNHAQILRYEPTDGSPGPVELVLSYDLTVGMGYAWGDEAYWNYLLDLADWKESDPYYKGANGTKGTLQEDPKDIPPGIVAGSTTRPDGSPGQRPGYPRHPGGNPSEAA